MPDENHRPNHRGCGLLTLGIFAVLFVSSSDHGDAPTISNSSAANIARPIPCTTCCVAPCLDGLPRRVINNTCCACPVDPSYVHEKVTSYALIVPGFVTFQLTVSLPDTYATVEWMGNRGNGARLQLPPAYQVSNPFGVDMGGVSPTFFGVVNNEVLGFAEADSWLTIGATDGSQPLIYNDNSFDFATSWTELTALNKTDAYIEFYGNSTPYSNVGEPVVLVQMTVTDAIAACGTASASVGGTRSDGAPWLESVVWSW